MNNKHHRFRVASALALFIWSGLYAFGQDTRQMAGQYFTGAMALDLSGDTRSAEIGEHANDPRAPAAIQFLYPAGTGIKIPIILIPGGGLTSWHYQETPDGRDGWAVELVQDNFPVYLVNPPVAILHDTGQRRWNAESVWPLWGFGPEFGETWPGARFPVEAIGRLEQAFAMQRGPGDAEQVGQLLEVLGEAVVVAHSAGGRTAFAVARNNPDRVRALVLIESLACPEDAAEIKATYIDGDIAVLSVWGDNLERGRPSMLDRKESCRRTGDLILESGGIAETLVLPERGIAGNSHLMMQDSNSEEILALITGWLKKNGLSELNK